MTDEKKLRIWGSVCLLSIALTLVGIVDGWNVAFFVPGLMFFSVAIKFFIHYVYKVKTGKDTRGMRFWKGVGRKLRGS